MKRTILLFIVIVSGYCSAVAQSSLQKKLDSLLAASNAHPQEDSQKAIIFREIFRTYGSQKNTVKQNQYIDSAVLVASRLPRKSILAFIYYRAGSSFHYADRFRAIGFYNKAIETATQYNATSVEAGAYLNLGALYMNISDYPKSLEAHEHAMEAYIKVNDIGGLSSCYMNMAEIYQGMNLKAKALEYNKKALKVFEDADSQRGTPIAYQSIANLYFNATDKELIEMGVPPASRLKEITAVLDKGLKYALRSEDNAIVSGYYAALGRLNVEKGNLKEAQKFYDLSLVTNEGNVEKDSYADHIAQAGNFYIRYIKDYPKGMALLHTSLDASRKLFILDASMEALRSLSVAHEQLRNYDSALFYYRQEIIARDSIYNKEKEQEFTRKQLKMDFDIKERDYKNAQQLADAKLKQQEQEITLRNQELEISDKEKTLQRLTFLQKQADMENQKKAQTALLVQEQLKADYDKKTKDQQISVQTVQLGANRRISIFLAILAIFVCTMALLIYNSRQKTVKLNKMVSEQKTELEELVKVKDKIFSIVSHDMRAPVNNIMAFSTLLEDGNIEQDRLLLYTEQIKGTLDHTSSLMENMLNWASSQMQGFSPQMDHVNIAFIVNQLLDGMKLPLYRKKITPENRINKNYMVYGDKNMVELILRNLLNNAIKFSNPDGKLILDAKEKDGLVILSVTDNGVGMQPSKVSLINNISSADSIQSTTGTAKEKGTGLGLMLCKQFAAMMRGTISVESTPGKGSIFSLSLPSAA